MNVVSYPEELYNRCQPVAKFRNLELILSEIADIRG